jgi:hypothetical protein
MFHHWGSVLFWKASAKNYYTSVWVWWQDQTKSGYSFSIGSSIILAAVAVAVLCVLLGMAFRSLFGRGSSSPHLTTPAKSKKASASETINSNGNGSTQKGALHSSKSTSPTTFKRRAQHDLIALQALQGGGGKNNAQNNNKGTSSSTIKQPLTIQDVNLALEGLDTAEEKAKRGDLQRAMNLYQISLEVLIGAISQPPPPSSTGSGLPCDTNVLKARVSLAMTDAEQIKSKLAEQNQHTKSNYPASTRTIRKANPKRVSPRQRPVTPSTSAALQTPAVTSSRSSDSTGNITSSNGDEYTKLVHSDMFIDTSTIRVKWDDVAGLERAKQALQEAVILPLLRPDLYTGLRAPPRGILLYGPPGTGKTLIVKAAACESNCTLLSCSSSTLTSKWHGEGEKVLRALFRVAAESSPSMIFVDEIDALLSKRKDDEHEASRRFKTEFMIQMEGIRNESDSSQNAHLLVLGCTNCPWDIDDAVMRRFQRKIYISMPDSATRRAVLSHMLDKCQPHSVTKPQMTRLVNTTEGYSCSDLTSIGGDAAFGPLRELGGMAQIAKAKLKNIRPVSYQDFVTTIQTTKPSVSKEILDKYKVWDSSSTNE